MVQRLSSLLGQRNYALPLPGVAPSAQHLRPAFISPATFLRNKLVLDDDLSKLMHSVLEVATHNWEGQAPGKKRLFDGIGKRSMDQHRPHQQQQQQPQMAWHVAAMHHHHSLQSHHHHAQPLAAPMVFVASIETLAPLFDELHPSKSPRRRTSQSAAYHGDRTLLSCAITIELEPSHESHESAPWIKQEKPPPQMNGNGPMTQISNGPPTTSSTLTTTTCDQHFRITFPMLNNMHKIIHLGRSCDCIEKPLPGQQAASTAAAAPNGRDAGHAQTSMDRSGQRENHPPGEVDNLSNHCLFGALLGELAQLQKLRERFEIEAKYLVRSIQNQWFATIQWNVWLNQQEFHAKGKPKAWIKDFSLAFMHFQQPLMECIQWEQKTSELSDDALLACLQEAKYMTCHVLGCKVHDRMKQIHRCFELADVFQRLETPLEIERMQIRDDVTYVERLESGGSCRFLLTDLPSAVLLEVFALLNAREIARMSTVCSVFQHLSYEVVPGLKLRLFPHQRKALKWMLYRESSASSKLKWSASRNATIDDSTGSTSTVFRGNNSNVNSIHPFLIPSLPDESCQKFIDPITNYILSRESLASLYCDSPGGLFCDEPGLGKTITMIALILRTKGQRSDQMSLLLQQAALNQGLSAYGSPTGSRRSSLRSSNSRNRQVPVDQLVNSHASLIIVPNPLINHWKFQMKQHVETHLLKFYVDDGHKKLPSAFELATYDVVVTTLNRLASEWRSGRPLCALEERMPERFGYEDQQQFADGTARGDVSPLLIVHWVRVIVDEGHKLGGLCPSFQMKMVRTLSADKRWVMTGTPAPNTLRYADLRHMHGLLVFLRDLPYGATDEKAWVNAIAQPFDQNQPEGLIRLQQLLSRIMLRHSKESILATLPKPVRRTVFIDPSPTEYEAYNTVVAAVRANLVITNMDPFLPGQKHQDSLLNLENRRYAGEVTSNLRLACCGGGKLHVRFTRAAMVDSLNMLQRLQLDPDVHDRIIKYLRDAESGIIENHCENCQRLLQLLMLVPCGHLCCADCVEDQILRDEQEFFHGNKQYARCPWCLMQYEREFFQQLQPGFEYRWQGARTSKKTNQRRFDRQVLEALEETAAEGRSNKALYVVRRILEETEARKQKILQRQSTREEAPPVIKAIVFSQFREHINWLSHAFKQNNVKMACFTSGYQSGKVRSRVDELHKFREKEEVQVLLMTEVGSHGLDLSFVTHIFLMDEFWDKSLEEQVIARAHRMGAKHEVVVEQLVMRDTIEQLMIDLNQRERESRQRSQQPQTQTQQFSQGIEQTNGHSQHQRQLHREHEKSSSLKETAVHQRVCWLLSHLRLLEQKARANDDELRFEVVENDTGRVIRKSSFTSHSAILVVQKDEVERQQRRAQLLSERQREALDFTGASAAIEMWQNATPARSSPAPRLSVNQEPMKQASMKQEPVSNPTQEGSPQKRKRRAPKFSLTRQHVVIDLTCDDDEEEEESVSRTESKPIAPESVMDSILGKAPPQVAGSVWPGQQRPNENTTGWPGRTNSNGDSATPKQTQINQRKHKQKSKDQSRGKNPILVNDPINPNKTRVQEQSNRSVNSGNPSRQVKPNQKSKPRVRFLEEPMRAATSTMQSGPAVVRPGPFHCESEASLDSRSTALSVAEPSVKREANNPRLAVMNDRPWAFPGDYILDDDSFDAQEDEEDDYDDYSDGYEYDDDKDEEYVPSTKRLKASSRVRFNL